MVWVGGRCSDGCLSGAARAATRIPGETTMALALTRRPHRQENAKLHERTVGQRMRTSDTHYL